MQGFINFELRTSNLLSMAGAETNDRTFFSASPALRAIGERETEQRGLGNRTLLDPGKSAIDGPIDHTPFSHNPSVLRVRKADTYEIGQLRTGQGAG